MITTKNIDNSIIQLKNSNNLFRLNWDVSPFSQKKKQRIVEELNSGNLELNSISLSWFLLGNKLIKIDVDNEDLIKLNVITELVISELKDHFHPYCAFKVISTDAIIEYGREWKLKDSYIFLGDIRKFYHSIKHDKLLEVLRHYNLSEKSISLVLGFLSLYSNSLKSFESHVSVNSSLPVGIKLSYILSHAVLMPIDDCIKKLTKIHYARFIDDFFMSSKDHNLLNETVDLWKYKLNDLELNFNPEKSRWYRSNEKITFLRHTL